MASRPPPAPAPAFNFYPAYCHRASPTYFTWVKLTASDVHSVLRSRPGADKTFGPVSRKNEGQLLFFLNHPVQFVCLVGVVVAFDEYFDKFWLFTLDDGSGTTIDVQCRKPEKMKKNGTTHEVGARTRHRDEQGIGEDNPRVEVISSLDIGSVVKVKGTIGTFREVRQISLERINVVLDTNAEVQFWGQRTQLLFDVLSKPWSLSKEKQDRLRREAEGEADVASGRAKRNKARQAKRLEREGRHAEQIEKQYAKEEIERNGAANMARGEGTLLLPGGAGNRITAS